MRQGQIARGDLEQLGLAQPFASVGEVAQQFRYPLLRLGDASQRNGLIVLFELLKKDALGQLSHHFVEQIDGQIAIGLQTFHCRLAGAQGIQLLLQGVDVPDLGIQLADFGANEFVALLLGADAHVEKGVDGRRNGHTRQHRQAQMDKKLLFLFLACQLSMRKEVDRNHWKNLLIAKPVATR